MGHFDFGVISGALVSLARVSRSTR